MSDNEELDLFDEEDLVELKRSRLVSVDQYFFDEDNNGGADAIPASQVPPFGVGSTRHRESLFPYHPIPIHNVHTMRPEYVVVSAVANYNLWALFTLQYARATKGAKVPPIVFDANTQSLIEQEIKFDF